VDNFFKSILQGLITIINDSNTLTVVILLGLVIIVMLFLLFYLISLRNYLTNTDDFFNRRIKDMKKDGMITDKDFMKIPVIHGKKTIIPLEHGELLHFYQKCQYFFFRLGDKVKNVNIDLLFSEKSSIDDFENIGNGRIFFTSKMLIFENVRSRNKILWTDITEIKVKFDHLILFDKEGCHAFRLENAELLSDFIYNIFLKEI